MTSTNANREGEIRVFCPLFSLKTLLKPPENPSKTGFPNLVSNLTAGFFLGNANFLKPGSTYGAYSKDRMEASDHLGN